MAVSSPDRIGTVCKAEKPVVHIDDFSPATQEGLNFGAKFLRDSIYGRGSGRFYEALVRGKKRVAASLEPAVNAEAIESIMNLWGIADPYVAGKFYQDQMSTANETIVHILGATLPGWQQNYSLQHEITSPSHNPSWTLQRAARGVVKNNKKMVYEAQRQSLLAVAAGSLNVRTEEDRLGTVRADFQDAILDIYDDPVAKPYILNTEHDDETGKVVKVGGHEVGVARATHFRRREYQARYINEVGPVIVGDRQKGDPEMLLKMLVKAKNRMLLGGEGYLQPKDATDAFGMKLVVLEPGKHGFEDNMQRLQDVLVDQLSKSEVLPIEYLEPDNGKSVDRGSSEHHEFLRLQVHLRGVSVPFEVIIQDAARMRNDEVMYGGPNIKAWEEYQYKAFYKETGVDLRGRLPDGAEHGLYKAKRYLFALPTLFPASIYGDRMIDQVLDNFQQRESWLRKVDKVETYDLSKFDVW